MHRHSTARHTVSGLLFQAGYTAPRDFRVRMVYGAILMEPRRRQHAQIAAALSARYAVTRTRWGNLLIGGQA